MAKGKKVVYFCQNCGHEETKWLGQCPACKEWNTFVEEKVLSTTVLSAVKTDREVQVVSLSEVSADDQDRITTGMEELDRVLGGGIVPGIPRSGRRRSGNWEINTSVASMSKTVGKSIGTLYFRRGITFSDQTSCK